MPGVKPVMPALTVTATVADPAVVVPFRRATVPANR